MVDTTFDLEELVSISTGKIDSNESNENGIYPFFTCAPEPLRINWHSFEADAILLSGNNANGIYHIHRYNGKFNAYQRTYVITTTRTDVSLDYLYYFLKLKLNYLRDASQGTATKFLTKKILYGISVKLPSKEVQDKVAHILTKLELKGRLNEQMNKILESIAQTLFKQWFIDFEFPDENGQPYKSSGGEMVDSEFGQIPKCWRLSKIGKEVRTVLGGTPSTKNKSYWLNGTVPWINSGKINEFRIIEPSEYITEKAVMESATKLMPKGTVVMAITGATLGQISRLEIDTCANQSVVGIIPTEFLISEYLYFVIQFNLYKLISNRTGGAQQHINKGNVENLEIIIPKEDIINKFKAVSKPIFENISTRSFENHTLSKLRDLILPKLMSGKIRVPLEDTNV